MRRGLFRLSMRILVTGGSGFIGGRLVDHFLKCGHHIKIGARNPITPPVKYTQVRVEKIVWNDNRSLEHLCDGVDLIIHAAGMNAQDCATNPMEALNFNGLATARLVGAASRLGVKRFLYLSTAHVYERPLVGDITEKAYPKNLHPYASSHLAGENAVLGANNLGKMEGVVLRLSNTFGVPMDKNKNCWMLLVNDLCKQAIQTGNLVLRSNGFEQRDFIGLNQVCRVIEELVIVDKLFKQAGVLNVGMGISHSLISMAQLVQQRCIKVLGFKPKIQGKKIWKDGENFSLAYRIDKLASLGIKCNDSENIEELDNLLMFCRTSFSLEAKKFNV